MTDIRAFGLTDIATVNADHSTTWLAALNDVSSPGCTTAYLIVKNDDPRPSVVMLPYAAFELGTDNGTPSEPWHGKATSGE